MVRIETDASPWEAQSQLILTKKHMNILHISDLHFGPRHWEGDDQELLAKINSYDADIVINTGDNTTDGLETEFVKAGRFLKAIKCKNIISTIGNHDKRNMRSHELFRKYICNSEIITIPETTKTKKTTFSSIGK
jgi:predicted MPP superfamily phosphohydrolase